jgi:hypothetical protein
MLIDFHFTTYNTYGGGFKPPLLYFNDFLSDYLKDNGIASSIEKLEITFAYPPKVKTKQNKSFYEWYDKLPYIRFSDKRKTLNITVRFNEAYKLLIKGKPLYDENLYPNEMLPLVCDKLIETFDIISKKLKKDDTLDTDKIKNLITDFKNKAQKEELYKIDKSYAAKRREELIGLREADRKRRSEANTEKNRLIQDIRFYYHFDDDGIDRYRYFSPYDDQIRGMILGTLRELKFYCPNYTHLYIQVADSYEEALMNSASSEIWFVRAPVVLESPRDYQKKSDKEKKQIVFDLIKAGLLDIAKIDKLDENKLKTALDKAQKEFL